MKAYTVHAPTYREDAEDRAVFIKDGISWPALFFPFLWILWHRLWTAAIWWIAFALVVAWIGRLLGEDSAAVVAILGQILFALEANNIRRWTLAGRGWEDIGDSFGANRQEAELRFFHDSDRPYLPARHFGPVSTAPAAAPAAGSGSPALAPQPATADRNVIGLFPEAQR